MRALVLLLFWCWAAGASAQEATSEEDMLETPDAVPAPPREALQSPEVTLPANYDVMNWELAPGGPAGILHPMTTTHPDYGLMIAGGLMATIAYVMGSTLSVFFGVLNTCWAGCRDEFAALGLIPLGEWAAGFSGSIGAFISGGVLAPLELIGLIILLAGVSSHHPELVPEERTRRPRRQRD